MRDSARRRSLARRRRRLFLTIQRINQDIIYFQYVRTITLAIMIMARMVAQINQRQYWEIPRPRLGWFEVIFGDGRQPVYWKEHFRMRKEIFLKLVDLVAPAIAKENTVLRNPIPPHKRVAIAPWRLAVGSSFRAIAAHFNVGKSTCVNITKAFCQALNTLSRHYIKFPNNCDETTRASATFSFINKSVYTRLGVARIIKLVKYFETTAILSIQTETNMSIACRKTKNLIG